jgi:hypothetical protein
MPYTTQIVVIFEVVYSSFSSSDRHVRADELVSVWTHGHVRVDVPIYPLGNFITDAIVRPSHGQPNGHRPRRCPRSFA